MRSTISVAVAAIIVLVAVPAAAQKVYVDYDKNFDFEAIKTFAWKATPEVSLKDTSPLIHSRIKNSIEYHLTTTGLVEDTENPDVYVTYYGDSKEEVQFHTTNFGYDYGPGWGWDPYWGGGMGMGTSTTTASTYEVGTLVIDLWDAESKTAIWRGTATATIPTNPAKEAKKIDRAVAKMIRTFEKQYAKDNK